MIVQHNSTLFGMLVQHIRRLSGRGFISFNLLNKNDCSAQQYAFWNAYSAYQTAFWKIILTSKISVSANFYI